MFSATFKKLTGFTPYRYQERVADAIISGRNVLLIAPTGSGKTWAAVAPFIHARFARASDAGNRRPCFADRLIYALPLRTLASSLHADVVRAAKEAFGEENIAISGKDRGYRQHSKLYITIQTGESQDDPLFAGDIVFTTIDQLLSSYINMPLSLPRRLSNINAGALVGAQIVLDEFHLLEAEKSLSTAIEMIDRLNSLVKVVIMTATLSNAGCQQLASILKAEKVELKDDERLMLPAESKRKRDWFFTGTPIDVSSVASVHKHRTIALCNTVNRAQALYLNIKETASSGTDVLLLHSRFYPDDRANIESEIIRRFGKNAQAQDDSIILVTTQVIEAGMDISCDTLHTEIAPINSLVQRAGRCARYGGKGDVYIYELPEPAKAAPYNQGLIDETRNILPPARAIIDFAQERDLIDAVHGKPESSFVEGFSVHSHRKRVAAAMAGDDSGAVRALIRDIDSVQIIVVANPSSIEFSFKKWPMSLSVPRFTLKKALKGTSGQAWLAELNDSDDDVWAGISWRQIENSKKDVAGAWYVVLHPNLASYSSKLGLTLGVSGSAPKVRYLGRPPIPLYRYKMETFKEHSERSLNAFERISQFYERGLNDLALLLNVSDEELRWLSGVLISLHDTGKLSVGWQSFAKAWQLKKNTKSAPQEPLAHTDYDPVKDAALMRSMPQRPPHAAEGAFALAGWLFSGAELAPGIATAAMTAVARHHSGRTSSVRQFEFIKEVEKVIGDTVNGNITGLRAPHDLVECKKFSEELINPLLDEDELYLPLYWYLVRLVRLCDQLATKEVNLR